jgi:hypothetical protein
VRFRLQALFPSRVVPGKTPLVGYPNSNPAKNTARGGSYANAGKCDRLTSSNALKTIMTAPLVKPLRYPPNTGQTPICLASRHDWAHS